MFLEIRSSTPFLLSVSEPEEPDHDDERLGGTSEYNNAFYQYISNYNLDD